MKNQKKIVSLIILSIAILIPLTTTISYYCSSDKITNAIKTKKYNFEILTDGGLINDNIEVKNNKIILPNIEKENYKFLGYSITETGDIIYKAKDEVSVGSINNKTLYGRFESNHEGINAIEKVLSLSKTDGNNIISDDGTSEHNIRYYGQNPNNYVKFNETDEDVWRIVGLFNDVEDVNGVKGKRLKLVREVSIGQYAWDSDPADVYGGFGANEWSDADLMKLLNPNFDNYQNSTVISCSYDYDSGERTCVQKSASEKVNNSLWWNNQKGICYWASWNRVEDCDFTIGEGKGLSNNAKSMIEEVVWNLGAAEESFYDDELGTPNHFYRYERSNDVYNCLGDDKRKCPRSTKWIGKVALLYPSDYGFATAGGGNVSRDQCLNTTLNHWGVYGNEDCVTNNYLYKSNRWFLTPLQSASESVMGGAYRGHVSTTKAGFNYNVYPSIFLKQNVLIIKGNGTAEDPYILKI